MERPEAAVAAPVGTIYIGLPGCVSIRLESNVECRNASRGAEEPALMIGLPAETQIWIAAGVTDMRRDFHGLNAQVQTVLEHSRCQATSSSFAGGVATF